MNDHRQRESSTHHHQSCCCFHPSHAVITGVCPFCLTERLEVIAVKQQHREQSTRRGGGGRKKHTSQDPQPPTSCSSYSSFPSKSKIFALGSLFNRRRNRHHPKRPDSDGDYAYGSACDDDLDDQCYTCSSLEDSFISIKFDDDGAPTWDKNNKSEPLEMSKKDQQQLVANHATKTESAELSVMVEHRKPGWQNRVRELLQLIRLKRRSAAVPCNAVDAKNKKKNKKKRISRGWIRRALSRRRCKD